jgi:zinc protease
LSNGVRVQLKPTDFKNDEILFSSHSPGGHSLVGDEDYIAAATTSSVVREGGVGQFNQIDLGKKLAGKVVGVSPSIGSLQEGISGSASPQDVETMFELVYAYFTTPRADSTAFQALKKRIEGSIQNRNARPETAFGDTMQVTLASYHHRARPWSMELLEELSLEKSMAIYRDRFSDAGDFTFTFVGNFSLEQMEPLVCAYLATLPSTGREETWRDVGIKGPEGVVEKFVYAGIEPKSSSRVVFSGPFEFDGWANNFAIDAMAAVFQIKLREVLREGLGGTYGVGVRASVEHFPREEYSININFGSDPERVEELTQVVFEQIDSLKTVGTTQVYIDKVVEMRKRSREVNLKENSFWRGTLQGFDINGTDPLLVLKYDELVENLTPEMVQKAAQKYFNIENYARFVLYPQDFAKKDGN